MADELITAEIVEEDLDIFERNNVVLYENYDELKQRIKERFNDEKRSIVWTRWMLGAQVKAVLDGAHYGTHKIEELEVDFELSRKTLYACKTLFETYSYEDMKDKIIPKQIPFRSLNYITRVADEEAREAYLDQVADGEIKAEDIPKLEASGKADSGGGSGEEDTTGGAGLNPLTPDAPDVNKSTASSIRKAVGNVDAAVDLILGHIDSAERSLDDLDMISNDKLYEALEGEFKGLITKLEAIQPKITSFLERASTKL